MSLCGRPLALAPCVLVTAAELPCGHGHVLAPAVVEVLALATLSWFTTVSPLLAAVDCAICSARRLASSFGTLPVNTS